MATPALHLFTVFLALVVMAYAKGPGSDYYYSGVSGSITSGEPITEDMQPIDDNSSQEPTGMIDPPSLTYESALLELRCDLACADKPQLGNSTIIKVATT